MSRRRQFLVALTEAQAKSKATLDGAAVAAVIQGVQRVDLDAQLARYAPPADIETFDPNEIARWEDDGGDVLPIEPKTQIESVPPPPQRVLGPDRPISRREKSDRRSRVERKR